MRFSQNHVEEKDLAVNFIQNRVGNFFTNYGFKFQGALLVWKVDEVTLMEVQKLEVILGLNSVSLVELAYRLELYDVLAVHDEVSPYMTYVLSRKEDGYNPFRLVVETHGPQSHLKGAVVHGLAVARPEGRPDSFGNSTNPGFHRVLHGF